MIRPRYFIFTLVTLLLAGCAAERTILTSDAGLTGSALRDGGLALVGVTMVDEVEQVRPPLVAALERAMAETRPDLPVRSARAVADSLGTPASRRILAAFQRQGTLDAATLAALAKDVSPFARFALFARVERSKLHLPPPPRPSDYDVGPPRYTGAIRRDARVRLTLYDLTRARVAWEAVYTSSSENALPDSLVRAPRPSAPITLDGGSPRSAVDLSMTPETPSLAEAATEAFRRFAGDLPR